MRYGLIVAAWLAAAILVGASGVLQTLRPPVPQLILVFLTIALLAVGRFSSAFQRWLRTVDLRLLIAIHVTRFVGFYFLFLCRHGELPCTFAITAGWGDILVATWATLLILCWKLVVRRGCGWRYGTPSASWTFFSLWQVPRGTASPIHFRWPRCCGCR